MGIANKIKSNQDKDGMLRRSLERLIQLYTDKSHFVYELLQNAEDAEAHCISFKQYEDRLEVMHDGIPFTEENLQGLCDIGKSDKVDNLNQIGEFGVGFKSVFGICDTVQLFSCPRKNGTGYNAFAVEIQDFTNPVDIELAEIPSPFTTKFVFPYKVGLPFSGFKTVERLNEVLSERLSDLGFTTLLFMKNLKLIEYEICINGKEQQGKYKLNKKQFDYNCTLVSAIDENDEDNKSENEQCFVVFSKAVNSNTPNRTVDIAFAATKDKNEKLIFQKADNPYISVYFPTETESKLDLIVQGPFRTTPNRSSVPADDESNKALALVVAQLLVESVRSLKKMGYMSVDLLNILPLKHEQFNVYSLFSPLFDSLKTLFISEPILPTNLKNVYVKASNALIARNNEMIELFPDNVISDLIKEYRQYEWIPEAVKETGPYSNVHAYLTNVLKIRSLRPEDLRKYFKSNPNFLKGQSKEWLVKMYKLFSLVPGVFAEETRVNNMLDTPFIMTKSGKIVAPYRKSDGKYIPNVFLPIQSYEYDFELVDPYLFGQCRDFFLHTLRLKQPDEYSLLVKSLEKRYAYRYYNGQIDEHIRDVKLILKYLNDATRCSDLKKHIAKNFYLQCHLNEKTVWSSPFEDKVLFPVTESGIRIEDYFRSINDNLSYINFSEYEKRGISYDDLKTLGVRDKITIGEDKVNGSHPLGEHSTYSVTWHTENSSFRWKLNLVDIIPVLKYIQKHPNETNSMIKSQAIFKTLQMNEEKLSGTLQLLKDKQLFRDEEQVSEIIFILRNKSESLLGTLWDGKWLYNSSNKLVSPQEISKHDLNESLYGRIDFDSKLYELLEFYWNDTDYREEKANEYDQLTDDQKESYFEIELQRRFGISISELDNVLSSGTVGGRSLELKEQDYEFPISKVKNWDTLKKHAAQSLFFADPVKYEIVQRSIRISKTSSRREYLLNMYRVNGNNMFACQICHKPFRSINDTQIEKTPTLELDQLNLCLCPNCARDFVPLRNNTNIINVFISKLAALSEGDIERNEYVEIPIADKKVWFTQTHAAEIAELLRLKNAIDKPHDLKAELKQFDHRLQVNVGFEEIDKGENRINDKSKSQTDASIIQNNVKKQIIETPIIDENNPESQRVKKTMKRLSVFDLNLVGKTVYLRSVLNYATVTKVNNEIIAFSVINKHGPNERIVYSRADCEKLDLVYKD